MIVGGISVSMQKGVIARKENDPMVWKNERALLCGTHSDE